MKLKFYEVDSEYIKFLRENGDERIPNIDYEKRKKTARTVLDRGLCREALVY